MDMMPNNNKYYKEHCEGINTFCLRQDKKQE